MATGAGGLTATADAGLRLQVDLDMQHSVAVRPHTVIVPGGEGIHRASADPDTLHWIRE